MAPMTVPGESASAPPLYPAHHTTGLFDDHPSRRKVPWIQEQLPEGVEPSLREVAEIQGGGTATPDASTRTEHTDQLRGMLLEQMFGLERKSRPDQGPVNPLDS